MNKTKIKIKPLIKCLHDRTTPLAISLEEAERPTLPGSHYCNTMENGTHYHHLNSHHSSHKLIFLHAMGGNLHNWMPVSAELSNRYDQYFVDLPWHGNTSYESMNNVSYEEFYITWLNDFIESIDAEKVSIIGHSLGGRVAAIYATIHPEKIENLVLLTPALSPSFRGIVALETEVLELMSSSKYTSFDRAVLKVFLNEMLINRRPETLVYLEYAIEEILRDQIPRKMSGVLHALRWFKQSSFDYEAFAVLADLVSITVLSGQKDIYCPNKELWNLENSRLKLEVVKRSGHLLPLEHPLICANRIKATILADAK